MHTLRRSWTLGFQQIIFKRDLQKGETAHPFFLGPNALADPFTRRATVDLYRALRANASADLTSPEAAQSVLRTIQQAIASGDLISVRREGISAGVSQNEGSSNSGQNQPPPRRKAAPPPPVNPREEKTWVEIRLVDEDGNPVSNAKYKLKITDGSVREGSLDGDGRTRVNGIDPGTCTVWFPDYDAREWSHR